MFSVIRRRQPTPAEQMLWRALRAKALAGLKFRRQEPIGSYIVDFYCHAAKLAVELDGRRHEWFAGYDEGRTEVLERLGVRIIRFSNDEVCGDLDSVLERIGEGIRLPFR